MQDKQSEAGGIANLFERRYEFAERYYGDEALRARVGTDDPEGTLLRLGIDPPEDMETRIVANTEDVVYFVFPLDPNKQLADEDLSVVAGGATGGSVACASTVGSFLSCLGSVGTASTASCAG